MDSETILNERPDADEIANAVIECVKNKAPHNMEACKVESVTRDTDLENDLSLDPLDRVELIMTVEDKLGRLPPYYSVSIPEEVCDNIETVGDLIDAACKVMGVRE